MSSPKTSAAAEATATFPMRERSESAAGAEPLRESLTLASPPASPASSCAALRVVNDVGWTPGLHQEIARPFQSSAAGGDLLHRTGKESRSNLASRIPRGPHGLCQPLLERFGV